VLFFNKTSKIFNVALARWADFIQFSDLEEYSDHWYIAFPGWMSNNPVERKRASRRIFSSDPPLPELAHKERLAVIREIMAHAETQIALLLENGDTSGNDLLLSEDEDEGELGGVEAQITVAEYKWSPDAVLCDLCFSTIFSELYYAWWLEERQTSRVESELVFVMMA
jgi:hypothetical protein